ncbi:tetratricopeptide repeat protein [Pseudobdellovibrio exovorus]|uniref:Uncharacterized protein n=1 Tax=Pseudobdellovibrio exovorus JSS TaxID=1184267 RepID=M4V4P3_9BACT|nr:tetratricopeptide repeat protein [Pseudobdellovibrio exovorus]AGH94307.1 hypothetical protein A11Q_87 [Pseudobdellovibrio exovorus JSS]
MSDNSGGQWVIKIQSDQVKGPYSTDAVIKMILQGVFSGNEEICAYPEGEWKALTKQPEFYDALLESLENPVEVDNKKTQKMEAETVVKAVEVAPVAADEMPPIPELKTSDDLKEFLEKELNKDKDEENKPEKSRRNRSLARTELMPQVQSIPVNPGAEMIANRDQNLEIQMSDLEDLKQKEMGKLLPFILLCIVAVCAVIYLLWPENQTEKKGWALYAPKKGAEALEETEVRNLKVKAVRALQSGIYEQILVAQQDMVRAVEGAPKDLEAMGLLCMIYEQLWPYTRQTIEGDIRSVMVVTQMARTLNAISNYSNSCQAVYLSVLGRGREARSLVEKTLDNQTEEKFSLGPFLYLMKAQMLEAEGTTVNAAAYYEQAMKLWPQWMIARFGLARMLFKQNKYEEARTQYEQMYEFNKESKAALFGLGLVENKGLRNPEKAYTFYTNGFRLKQVLPKDFATEALQNYAQLLMEKNENKKALEAAQEGYRLSPSHRGLKEMVVSLGGDEKVENAQSEIMLIGDQFFRNGDYMVAQAQYKTAFELDTKNGLAAYKAARALWLMNQTRDAILWLDKSIEADPKLLPAYVLKSDYESQKYNFLEAAKTLQKASRAFPQNHEVLKAQALLEFRKNNMMGAIQYGERAVKLYSADVELLTLLAQAHIYFYVNAPATRQQDLDRKEASKTAAQRYAGRAVDLEPSWPESQITWAKVLSATDGPTRGQNYLKEMIKAFPYTLDYRIALAEFYRDSEKFLDSSKVYEEVVSIDPKSKRASLGLAEAYRILNKPDLAQKYYNITSVLDPSDVEPMVANARLLVETAAGNEVRAKMQQALTKLLLVKKINPDFPKVSFLMAKCYMELGDYDKAIEMIKEEKTRNPNIADSYILAAEIFFRRQQYKECAVEYSAATRMRPSSAELYVRASTCYRMSDSIDIAEDMLNIAAQKESGFADIYRELGYIYERKNGGRVQAVQYFRRYLSLSPNAPDRTTVEGRIRQMGEQP